MSLTRTALTSLCLLCLTLTAGAQNGDDEPELSIFDWFYAPDEMLKVEIQADLDSLIAGKFTENKYPGVFTIIRQDGEELQLPMKLTTRGRYRRKVCDFPPIKLDFDKDVLIERGLKKHDEYKLVSQCFDDLFSEDAVKREYLVYRLYEELTDKSFRVQLVKIKYRNAKGKRLYTHFGFIIEDEKELAERLECELFEDLFNLPVDSLVQKDLHRHDLFQYMIGNTDWSLPMSRNMKFLSPEDKPYYSIVPYDFDFSGLVDAAYARPNIDLKQTSILERHYLGVAKSPEELKTTLAFFKTKKDALIRRIKQFKILNSELRFKMVKYLESFYDSLEDGSFQNALTPD